jgi:predicted O-methyltransferase YrrM
MVPLAPQVVQIAEMLAGQGAAPELGWVSRLVGRDPAFVRATLLEIADCVGIEQSIHEAHQDKGRIYYAQFRAPLELYAIVRALRPFHIVESGVSSGVSSAQLLLGLERNRVGRLHSIDYPVFQRKPTKSRREASWSLPPGARSGWAVPDELRRLWDLRVGRSEDVLPGLVDELPSIDLFVHDSPHNAAHLAFELKTIRPKLRPGSVVVADNTRWNERAFNQLAASFHATVLHRRASDLAGFRVPGPPAALGSISQR